MPDTIRELLLELDTQMARGREASFEIMYRSVYTISRMMSKCGMPRLWKYACHRALVYYGLSYRFINAVFLYPRHNNVDVDWRCVDFMALACRRFLLVVRILNVLQCKLPQHILIDIVRRGTALQMELHHDDVMNIPYDSSPVYAYENHDEATRICSDTRTPDLWRQEYRRQRHN